MSVIKGYIKAYNYDSFAKEFKYISAPAETKMVFLRVVEFIEDTLNEEIQSPLLQPAEAISIDVHNAGGDNMDAEVAFQFAISLKGTNLDEKSVIKQMEAKLNKVAKKLQKETGKPVMLNDYVMRINDPYAFTTYDKNFLYPSISFRIQIYL